MILSILWLFNRPRCPTVSSPELHHQKAQTPKASITQKTLQNPDGTYYVEVADGMNMLNLESWYDAINNVPDNAFINQPRNRKQALKNKFDAVFNMLGVNNYDGAIDKLTNDILKKLDADKQRADWVKESVLVNELRAFIGLLKYKISEIER